MKLIIYRWHYYNYKKYKVSAGGKGPWRLIFLHL